MIGRLRGTLTKKRPPRLILDVNGVGYKAEVPVTALYRLPSVDEPVTLHTHLVAHEDAHLFYGFTKERERELFRELIRLNGVGPRLALALMSGLGVNELVRCVQAQDTFTLVKTLSADKKTAERLLVELKDRFEAWEDTPTIASLMMEPRGSVTVSGAEADAVGALTALGFRPQEASRAVTAIPGGDSSSEGMICQTLRGTVQVTFDDRA